MLYIDSPMLRCTESQYSKFISTPHSRVPHRNGPTIRYAVAHRASHSLVTQRAPRSIRACNHTLCHSVRHLCGPSMSCGQFVAVTRLRLRGRAVNALLELLRTLDLSAPSRALFAASGCCTSPSRDDFGPTGAAVHTTLLGQGPQYEEKQRIHAGSGHRRASRGLMRRLE